MEHTTHYQGGENFSLRDILLAGRTMRLEQRLQSFAAFTSDLRGRNESLCLREMLSSAGREMSVRDPETGAARPMLMFGSNNYLGLADHPRVRAAVRQAIEEFGIGMGGPPLLNGYTTLHRRLEERLAALKGADDALVFSTGYGANLGLVSALAAADDLVLYDAYSHASFHDGLALSGAQSHAFRHNDLDGLERLLRAAAASCTGDVFVGVEGVYSMDGDTAPLDAIVSLCTAHHAHLIVDDAHGTGVMGDTGRGTAEALGVEGGIDFTVGTFSKAFGVVGGFVAASRQAVEYLRYFARSYMFSASLPPVVAAAVLAGLDVMEDEPERLARLHDNRRRACAGLRGIGIEVDTPSAIIALRVPPSMQIRRASHRFHRLGIFVNSIEYPAVPLREQRFRISLSADHTPEDIDRLIEAVSIVWSEEADAAYVTACATARAAA